MRMRGLVGAVVVALVLLTGGVSGVSADIIDYTLSIPNVALGTGPYATVDVNRTSLTTATITFTSLSNGGNLYLIGDGGAADVNVNAASFTVTNVSESNSVAGFAPAFSNVTSGVVDGFGSFNVNLNNSDGFTGSATSISFLVTNTAGTWSSAGQVLTNNADNFLAAAHIFTCVLPCTTTEGALVTGFAANGEAAVPEPASLTLVGVGLAALGLTRRRRG